MLFCYKFENSYVPAANDPTWSILFTFCAILIAILSLWAQLTVRINQDQNITKNKLSTIGLFWIYSAIVCSVGALGFLIYSRTGAILDDTTKYVIYRIGLGLMMASFLMGSVHVVESVISLGVKILRNLNLSDSLVSEIDQQVYRTTLYWLLGSIVLVLIFSICGTLFGPEKMSVFYFDFANLYFLWFGNIIAFVVAVIGYCNLNKGNAVCISNHIKDKKILNIWRKVWDKLPHSVQAKLISSVRFVKDTAHYSGKKYVYGSYGDSDQTITLYTEDLFGLSEKAITGVVAHELGHAYCHICYGSAAPFANDSEKGANGIASAWGFKNEIESLSRERKPDEDTDVW